MALSNAEECEPEQRNEYARRARACDRWRQRASGEPWPLLVAVAVRTAAPLSARVGRPQSYRDGQFGRVRQPLRDLIDAQHSRQPHCARDLYRLLKLGRAGPGAARRKVVLAQTLLASGRERCRDRHELACLGIHCGLSGGPCAGLRASAGGHGCSLLNDVHSTADTAVADITFVNSITYINGH